MNGTELMEFRKDINGLRAIAVAAVVLYHFGIAPFTGGFVGVDIFFVISGFLLTSITYREIQTDVFSRREFLMRRVRRIFPAIAVVTLVCLAWAGFFYLPGDYNRLVRDATGVVIMRSNYVFHGDTGYFAPDSKENLFLHTWSLSLESQFYLGFAILCTLLWPRSGEVRRKLGAALFAGLAVASAAWCVVHTPADQLSAFYLIWCRAWEFMAGSAVALYGTGKRNRLQCNSAAIAGVVLLGFSIVAFDASAPYPGWRALLPVAGTALVIFARDGLVTRLLSSWPFQFLGRISYSVYLWHWPLLLAYRERVGHSPAGLQAMLLIGASILAGWLSFRLVEIPTRRKATNRHLLIGSLGCVASVFAFSGIVSAMDGWPQRLPAYLKPAVVAMVNSTERDHECSRRVDGTKPTPGQFVGEFCHFGPGSGDTPPTMILWGDSFAGRIQAPVEAIANKLGISGIVATEGGCPPFKGKVFKGSGAEVFSGCERYSNFVFDYFANTPSIKLAVIAGDWQRYAPQYEGDVIKQIATILASRGGRLVLVTTVPNPRGDLPHQWARAQFQAGHTLNEMSVPRDGQVGIYGMGQQIASIASEAGNVIVVDPFSAMCTAEVCFTVEDDKGLFSDTDHLSAFGVQYLVPDLDAAITRAHGELGAKVGGNRAAIKSPDRQE
jgi:peptidoglycan/LPS O-acetylase OafA/YrhL